MKNFNSDLRSTFESLKVDLLFTIKELEEIKQAWRSGDLYPSKAKYGFFFSPLTHATVAKLGKKFQWRDPSWLSFNKSLEAGELMVEFVSFTPSPIPSIFERVLNFIKGKKILVNCRVHLHITKMGYGEMKAPKRNSAPVTETVVTEESNVLPFRR